MAAYLDGSGSVTAFDTANRVNPPRFSFPFPQDPTTQAVELDYRQLYANWSAGTLDSTAAAAGESFSGAATFYLVSESPLRPIGAGVVEWTRTYMEIPAQRSEYESYAYRIPGLEGNIESVWQLVTSSSGAGTGTITITKASHGLSAGDIVYIGYYYTDNGTGGTFGRLLPREVLTAPTTGTFTIAEIVEDGTVTYQKFVNAGSNRRPRTVVVNSRLQFDYYLPGVTALISVPGDITILQPTKILDPEGNEVESYSDITNPTQATYLSSTVGTEVVVEESILRRMAGNIYERITRYAEAR